MLLEDACRNNEEDELGLGTFLRAVPGPVNTDLFTSDDAKPLAYRVGEECWDFFPDERR